MRLLARILLVLAVALLAGAAGVAFSERQPTEYSATMQFAFGRQFAPEYQLLGPAFGEPDVEEEVKIATEAQGVRSFDVAEATARAAPDLGYTAGEVAARITALPRRGTLIVTLRTRASSSARAARLAEVYAGEYLALRRREERERASTILSALKQRHRELSPGQKRGPVGAGLRDQISRLHVLRRIGSGSPEVIQKARASTRPTQPKTFRNTLFAALFGLAVGIGLVALRSDTRGRATSAAKRRMTKLADGSPQRDG